MKTKKVETNNLWYRAPLLGNIPYKYVNTYEPKVLKRRLQIFYWNIFLDKYSKTSVARGEFSVDAIIMGTAMKNSNSVIDSVGL